MRGRSPDTRCAANRACQYGHVLDDLAAATREYRAAQDAVSTAEQAVVDARAAVPAARERLHAAIVAAARAGHRQREIVEVTGYNRESVRRILRSGGVEPDE
jgi:chemotaxis regulatin CheY-phosphate phosphatase CheZ